MDKIKLAVSLFSFYFFFGVYVNVMTIDADRNNNGRNERYLHTNDPNDDSRRTVSNQLKLKTQRKHYTHRMWCVAYTRCSIFDSEYALEWLRAALSYSRNCGIHRIRSIRHTAVTIRLRTIPEETFRCMVV